jgi:hypothetical protein
MPNLGDGQSSRQPPTGSLTRLARQAGITTHISPYSLRHNRQELALLGSNNGKQSGSIEVAPVPSIGTLTLS